MHCYEQKTDTLFSFSPSLNIGNMIPLKNRALQVSEFIHLETLDSMELSNRILQPSMITIPQTKHQWLGTIMVISSRKTYK